MWTISYSDLGLPPAVHVRVKTCFQAKRAYDKLVKRGIQGLRIARDSHTTEYSTLVRETELVYNRRIERQTRQYTAMVSRGYISRDFLTAFIETKSRAKALKLLEQRGQSAKGSA